jgi:peptide/nickel transport system permease protein
VLPVVTLAAPGVAIIARQTRDSMLSTVQRPFMRTLRAAGLPGRSLLLKHALRNAAIPVLTVIGVVFVGALSGTVIAEVVFALPGLGGEAVNATTVHDVPVVQGVALYFTVMVIAVNLVIDIAYGWLDPRVRVS